MTTRVLYPKGRASALPYGRGFRPDDYTDLPDYNLVARLRAVRACGDEAMTAAEEYDPNFELKLCACTTWNDVDRLLDEWLSRRVAVLEHTKAELRRVRRNARLSAKDRTDGHATAQHSRLRLRPDQAKTRRRRAP